VSGGPSPRCRAPVDAALVKEGANRHSDVLHLSTEAAGHDFRVRVPLMVERGRHVLSEAVKQYKSSDKGKIGTALQASLTSRVLLKPALTRPVMELTTPRAAQLRRRTCTRATAGVVLNQVPLSSW